MLVELTRGYSAEIDDEEFAYISRAIFRHRIDKPEDNPTLAAKLDPKISLARMRAHEDAKNYGRGGVSSL